MNAIAIVIVSVVGLIFVILLISAILTIYDLEKAKQNLKEDNSKLSDALRRKGIEVGQLKKKIKRLEEGR
jgi:hypothetical protein